MKNDMLFSDDEVVRMTTTLQQLDLMPDQNEEAIPWIKKAYPDLTFHYSTTNVTLSPNEAGFYSVVRNMIKPIGFGIRLGQGSLRLRMQKARLINLQLKAAGYSFENIHLRYFE